MPSMSRKISNEFHRQLQALQPRANDHHSKLRANSTHVILLCTPALHQPLCSDTASLSSRSRCMHLLHLSLCPRSRCTLHLNLQWDFQWGHQSQHAKIIQLRKRDLHTTVGAMDFHTAAAE